MDMTIGNILFIGRSRPLRAPNTRCLGPVADRFDATLFARQSHRLKPEAVGHAVAALVASGLMGVQRQDM